MDLIKVEAAIEDLLAQLEPGTHDREGLADTPRRMSEAWREWTSGYDVDVAELLTVFDGENYDEMVSVVDIPFYSHCEHHLAPFFGTATVAYVPKTKIVGLSKINRLVGVYAARLQVQERLTSQIASALMLHLNPLGAACKITARHLCMESRGVRQQGQYTVTTSLHGVFRTKPEARAEFLAL